jgi:hypothetical protein
MAATSSDAIRSELPEIDLLIDDTLRKGVIGVWASFLGESSNRLIADAPAFPGLLTTTWLSTQGT